MFTPLHVSEISHIDSYNSINFTPLIYAIVWLHHSFYSPGLLLMPIYVLLSLYTIRNNVAICIFVRDSLCTCARNYLEWNCRVEGMLSILCFVKLLSKVVVPMNSVWEFPQPSNLTKIWYCQTYTFLPIWRMWGDISLIF